MKKIALQTILAACLTSSSLIALDPPKPVTGQPQIFTPLFSVNVRDANVAIKAPSGWGIGEISTSKTSTSYMYLYPVNGGNGFLIEIDAYADEAATKGVLKQYQSTFKTTTPFNNGFETELKSAWYSGYTSGEFLIQMWYSLPKKKSDSQKTWNALKQCFTLQPYGITSSIEGSDRAPVEKFTTGWVCHHPENKVDVYFETFPLMTVTKTERPRVVKPIEVRRL